MTTTLTGKSVLLMLAAFFGIIVAVNVVFIVKAVTTFSGEDEADPYLQGVGYNQTLAHREAQKTLGWRATIGAAREPAGRARVVVMLSSRAGEPVAHLTLKGELRRPTDAARDRSLAFREIAPGHYASEARNVDPGVWDVVVDSATRTPFEASRRLWIP